MSSPDSVLSGESFHGPSFSSTPSLIFEDVSLTEARLSHSTTPTPLTRKRHIPEERIPIHSEFSGPFGTVSTFRSEPLGGVLVNVAQQLRKDSLGLLVPDEDSSKSRADFQPDTGEVFQPSGQVIGVEIDKQSSHLPLRASPPAIASNATLVEDGDKENDQLLDGELQLQADQESTVPQQELDDNFVPDPFITFQVIAEEFHINSNIADPHGDIRRVELVTEIHQRLMKTLSDQYREESDISPQQLPTTDIADLAREEPTVEERSEQCSFCWLASFDGSTDEDIVLLNSKMVDCCDECRDCQTFRGEYEWLVEASQAYCERYSGGAEANTGDP
jgi:hypothetical protein